MRRTGAWVEAMNGSCTHCSAEARADMRVGVAARLVARFEAASCGRARVEYEREEDHHSGVVVLATGEDRDDRDDLEGQEPDAVLRTGQLGAVKGATERQYDPEACHGGHMGRRIVGRTAAAQAADLNTDFGLVLGTVAEELGFEMAEVLEPEQVP